MSKYAEKTSVSSQKSRMEIERTLTRYGADGFMYGSTPNQAVVAFRAAGRMVRFELPMPDRNDDEFKRTPARRNVRTTDQQLAAWEQACRQRWRALALAIKAKLEAIDAGIATFEEEFMANIVLPDGATVAQDVLPKIQQAYETGKMPPLLPHYG